MALRELIGKEELFRKTQNEIVLVILEEEGRGWTGIRNDLFGLWESFVNGAAECCVSEAAGKKALNDLVGAISGCEGAAMFIKPDNNAYIVGPVYWADTQNTNSWDVVAVCCEVNVLRKEIMGWQTMSIDGFTQEHVAAKLAGGDAPLLSVCDMMMQSRRPAPRTSLDRFVAYTS